MIGLERVHHSWKPLLNTLNTDYFIHFFNELAGDCNFYHSNSSRNAASGTECRTGKSAFECMSIQFEIADIVQSAICGQLEWVRD